MVVRCGPARTQGAEPPRPGPVAAPREGRTPVRTALVGVVRVPFWRPVRWLRPASHAAACGKGLPTADASTTACGSHGPGVPPRTGRAARRSFRDAASSPSPRAPARSSSSTRRATPSGASTPRRRRFRGRRRRSDRGRAWCSRTRPRSRGARAAPRAPSRRRGRGVLGRQRPFGADLDDVALRGVGPRGLADGVASGDAGACGILGDRRLVGHPGGHVPREGPGERGDDQRKQEHRPSASAVKLCECGEPYNCPFVE